MTSASEALPNRPTNCFGRMLRTALLIPVALSNLKEVGLDRSLFWVTFQFMRARCLKTDAANALERAEDDLANAELRVIEALFNQPSKG